MKKLILLILTAGLLAGCMTVNIHNYADGCVSVQMEKPISTSTLPVDLKTRDVTVPMSAVP